MDMSEVCGNATSKTTANDHFKVQHHLEHDSSAKTLGGLGYSEEGPLPATMAFCRVHGPSSGSSSKDPPGFATKPLVPAGPRSILPFAPLKPALSQSPAYPSAALLLFFFRSTHSSLYQPSHKLHSTSSNPRGTSSHYFLHPRFPQKVTFDPATSLDCRRDQSLEATRTS